MSQIEKICYGKIECEDCDEAFKNLDIWNKNIEEEYKIESVILIIETYLRRSKLRRIM